MRYLGIDYGNKRIGLALSDEDGVFAFPYLTIENTASALEEIRTVCEKEKVGKIVLGVPVPFSGGASLYTDEVRRWGETLFVSVGMPVAYENEILTTKMAIQEGIGKATADQSSAALTLQGYLDKRKETRQ